MIDNTAVWTALIVAVPTALTSTLTPMILALMTNRAKREERREDYARQDQVAARVAETARTLTESTTLANNKLDTIHTLVNSNMTAAMQNELDATVRESVMMQELMHLKETMGLRPTIETIAELKKTTDRIKELHEHLRDRQK